MALRDGEEFGREGEGEGGLNQARKVYRAIR